MKILGIDLGTTTISAVVIDKKTGNNCISRTIENNTFLSGGQDWEKLQDPEKILVKAVDLIHQMERQFPDIEAVGITGQMHGILYVDEQGKSVSPLYTWQDGRGNQPLSDGESACEQIKKLCGEQVSSGYGLVTHYYQVKTGQMPKRARKLCTIGDYLAMRLTGAKEPLMHSSNGASLGFYDPKHGVFRTEAMEKCGMDPSILPRTTSAFASCGTYGKAVVCTAIGDNQASFLGTVEEFTDTILVNVGTGSQISVYSRQYFTAKGIEARPFEEDSYLLVGAPLCGGRSYAVLEQFFRAYGEAMGVRDADHYRIMAGFLEREEEMEEERESPLKVTTAFSGTREEPEKRGSIENISTENFTPGNLIRGFLEGMTEELYERYRIIENATGISPKYILASGNGVRRNPYLQKLISRKFGKEFILAQGQEEAARGAARAAAALLKEEIS